MPVQVNEMVIRASVGDTDTRNVASSVKAPTQAGDDAKQEMIAECVAQVLDILKRENIR